MRLAHLFMFAAAAGFVVTSALPADAQRGRAQVRSAQPPTVFHSRDETGRRTTRIIVQRRSFLDAGTDVLPGQRKFTDYVIPPYYSPLDVLGPGRNGDRGPLNPLWQSNGVRLPF